MHLPMLRPRDVLEEPESTTQAESMTTATLYRGGFPAITGTWPVNAIPTKPPSAALSQVFSYGRTGAGFVTVTEYDPGMTLWADTVATSTPTPVASGNRDRPYPPPPYDVDYTADLNGVPTTWTATTTDFSTITDVAVPKISLGPPPDPRLATGAKVAIIIACIFGVVAIIIASIWFCCGRPRRRRLKAQEDMQLHRERMEAAAREQERPLGDSVQNLTTSAPPAVGESAEMTFTGAGLQSSIAPVQAVGAVGRTPSNSNVHRHVSLRGGGSDAPPSYEEVVPPSHQRLAGGMVQRGHNGISVASPVDEEDGAGMVADGKMPLSEMPFEDVVVERQRNDSGVSSAANFEEGGRNFHDRHAMQGGDTTGHSNV